jgi:DNA-binding MarR family transcriptional regulator
MRLTDLARAEHVKPPTMTRIVAALEAGQLAQRKSDPTDARSMQIRATARGTKLMREGRRQRILKLADALSAISEEELAVLNRAAAIIERVSHVM